VDSDMIFNPTQLTEIYRALEYSLRENPNLSTEQDRTIQSALKQIEGLLPELPSLDMAGQIQKM
jgi:hypothetical protein